MHSSNQWPTIIQGGMGIGVSHYRLAQAAARAGCLGVVSGTGIDSVLVRRLQLGDPSGDMRRAMARFPYQDVSERCLARYFVPGGKAPEQPFKLLPLPNVDMGFRRLELLVLANFVEVTLAKEQSGLIGINYLEKIQTPTLASLFGAMLGGVDVVLMGAGIPAAIPEALERLSEWHPAELRLNVEGGREQPHRLRFDPKELFGTREVSLRVPKFIAIVSSHVLAKVLVKKTYGRVDGFVVEDHTAGGHNAPPRKGNFGPLDAPDLAAMRALGVPFWVAGSAASPERLLAARNAGALGVQIGSAFAFCEESGITSEIKRDVVARALKHRLCVVTDFQASPTGYPFKRIERPELPGELAALRARPRVCDLGYLRRAYVDDAGRLGYRCPGEPVESFVRKGGDLAETENKLCLCNQLFATIGLGQARDTGAELPLVTAGEDLAVLKRFVKDGPSYHARDVVDFVLGLPPMAQSGS